MASYDKQYWLDASQQKANSVTVTAIYCPENHANNIMKFKLKYAMLYKNKIFKFPSMMTEILKRKYNKLIVYLWPVLVTQ